MIKSLIKDIIENMKKKLTLKIMTEKISSDYKKGWNDCLKELEGYTER